MENKDKCKKRSNNFSREENKLKELLQKYHVSLSKKTDHASSKQKDEAWSQLTNDFNTDSFTYRSKKQLINKFNNMKKVARKELSHEKKERRITGGGPPPAKPSDTSEWICSIMSESIIGLPSTCDSDLIHANSTNNMQELVQNVTVPVISEEEPFDLQLEDQTNEIIIVGDTIGNCESVIDFQGHDAKFDTTTPKSMLRQPVSKPLDNRKRKLMFTPLETRKKIITMTSEKENFIKKKSVREEKLLEFAEEEHFKNMLHKEELHTMEVEFNKRLHELILKKEELEIEEEKLKNIKC